MESCAVELLTCQREPGLPVGPHPASMAIVLLPFHPCFVHSVPVLLFVCLLRWKYQCVKKARGSQVFISLLIGRLSSLPILGHFDIKSLKSKEIHSVVLNLVKKVAPSLKWLSCWVKRNSVVFGLWWWLSVPLGRLGKLTREIEYLCVTWKRYK